MNSAAKLITGGPYREALRDVLSHFRPACAGILARRALLRRIDTKFLVPATAIETLLDQLTDSYGVLRARQEAVARYESLYFDTQELACFHDHRRGRRPRQKIRVRHYPDRQVSFLEVKTKKNDLLTIKHRLERPFGDSSLDRDAHEFLSAHCRLSPGSLRRQAWTNFHRLTLIGLHTNERVTIDLDLQLVRQDIDRTLNKLVIAEVKQSLFCARTPVMRALRGLGLRPASASKYCTAIALASRERIRTNRLLPSLRAVERMAS